jgi:pyridoxal phosphate enzyme (YggS family)
VVAADDFGPLLDRLAAARERVARAAQQAGRPDDDVALLLATKTVGIEAVRACLAAGEGLIGENRVQEMVAKAPNLADLAHETHVIGPLQSNKARAAVRFADCIQTIADIGLAARLDRASDRLLAVMIQVNTSGESTKSGCLPSAALDLAAATDILPNLQVTGFMTVGLHSCDQAAVGRSFARLRDIRDAAVAGGLVRAGHLSMGMSEDLEIAVAEGSTMVRLGTSVFGPRRSG